MSYDFEDLHDINEYEEYTRSYDTRYIAEVRHFGLGTYRVLKDLDYGILLNKIEAQFYKWDEQWSKIDGKNKSQADKEANLSIAEERTSEAQNIQRDIENILIHTLDIDDAIDWNDLKNYNKFSTPNPILQLSKDLKKITDPASPVSKNYPTQPNKENFDPSLSFFDNLFSSLKQKKIDQAERLYQLELDDWEKEFSKTEEFNQKVLVEYNEQIIKQEQERTKTRKHYDDLETEWKKQEEEFYKQQSESNNKIEKLRELYLSCDPEAIIEYCELVLNNSEYPEVFPKDFDLDYNKDSKILIIEYVLPAPSNIPTLTEVKYIATKKELKESHISETQIAKIYDNTIYQISLRTLHEIFEADQANAIEAIVFNGWVEAINKATGKKVNSCIVSIQAKKSEFIEIELSNVDPKTCFKNLKGIASSKLSGIVAVQPILQINRQDKRFVSSYDVIDKINEGDNLASMDWEDFEHLLRELFAKEFSSNGGEVKVTQASRDGGVDAIAFDPDPIRGGKIVIQAKRYTNTVGVSAVRDLYGTVMNEGATKGILVTTADFGPDAYEFSKNKPITLMNGANLLYLLEKHGQKARIDLAEAKRLQQQN
jgi:restriction system protein